MSAAPPSADTASPAPLRRKGIRALIDGDVARQQRLPLLEGVCERMLRSLAASTRDLAPEAMETSVCGVTSARFGELMGEAPTPAMFGIFRLDPWGSQGLLAVEPPLIFAAVDALLGGRQGAEAPPRPQGRAFTTIETSLVGRLMERILADFCSAFAPVAPVTATLERIETAPRFAAIAGPAILTAHCHFRLDIGPRGGCFSLLLPFPALEPVRARLSQPFAAEPAPGAPRSWAGEIEQELRRLPMRLDAVVGRRAMTLSEIGRLSVGDQLRFDPAAPDQARLVHGGTLLARGALGRRGNQAALRLTHPIGEMEA